MSTEVPSASRVHLAPGGGMAWLSRPPSGAESSLEFRARAEGPPVRTLPAPPGAWWDSADWSRDGARWAALSERWEANQRRSRVIVGARDRDELLLDIDAPCGAPITINHQSQSAPLIALSPDGARAALRANVDERNAVVTIDVARGVAEVHALPASAPDLFAHAWGGDGALYTVSTHAGARGGVARWTPQGATARRWEWATGCTLAPAPGGVWALGLGGVVWRIGAGGGGFTTAKDARLARARGLRARATHRWDVGYLDHLIDGIANDRREFCWETNTPRARWGPLPDEMPDARGFDTPFLWECAFAAPVGDDALLVSDGLSLALLRDRGGALSHATLLEDEERCSPRARRIVGLTAADGAVGILWKKSAASTQLSLFDLDVAAV